MSLSYFVGVLVGFAIVLLIVFILRKSRGASMLAAEEFDERQLLIRNKGYKYGFVTIMVYGLLYFLYSAAGGKPIMLDGVAAFLGVMLGVFVFSCYNSLHDAQFGYRESGKRYLVGYGIIAAICIAVSIINLVEGGLVQNGMIDKTIVTLVMGIGFLALFICILVNMRRQDGAGDDE